MSNNIQNNNELSDKLDLINRNLRTLRIDFNETIREIIRQEFSKLLGQHLKEERQGVESGVGHDRYRSSS